MGEITEAMIEAAARARDLAERQWMDTVRKRRLAKDIVELVALARRTAAEAMRERAAKVAETPDEDDDDLDRQTRRAAAAAIRALEIEGDAK